MKIIKKWPRTLLYILAGLVFIILALGSYYYVPDIPPDVLNRKYNVKESHYIRVQGMDVHYLTNGPVSDSLPLVLLHGTSSSLYTWNGWAEILAINHKIIRMDLPGFGLTGPHPQEDYSVDSYLSFLKAFLSELKVKQCILAGNSIGGEIAWRYTLKQPAQVKKLILIGTAGYPVEMEKLPVSKIPLSYIWLRIPVVRKFSVKFATPQVIRNSLEYLYGNPGKVSGELTELYFDMAHREGNPEALTERMESFLNPSPWKRIPEIKTPVLILWGEKDRLIPVEHAKKFHRNLPESKLVIFPDAGHMPMEEIPEKSAEAAKEFIEKSLDSSDSLEYHPPVVKKSSKHISNISPSFLAETNP